MKWILITLILDLNSTGYEVKRGTKFETRAECEVMAIRHRQFEQRAQDGISLFQGTDKRPHHWYCEKEGK